MKNLLKTLSICYLAGILLTSCSNNKSIKLFPVKAGDKWEYIDRDGKIIINAQFDQANFFREGLALVETSSKYNFITEDGKYPSKKDYKQALDFSEGFAWVVPENSFPIAINTKGETQISFKDAETVESFKEGLAAFTNKDDKCGFIDKSGKIIINPQFKNVHSFSNGLAAVKLDQKWGYINNKGDIVINYQFENEVANFKNDVACVSNSDRKWGLIDKTGKYVVNPQFDIMVNDGDLFIIRQDNKLGWCDKSGKIIINPQFDNLYFFGSNDLAPVHSGKSWGFVDKEGKIAINPQFDEALPFNGGLAFVYSSKNWGLIDKEGKYKVNPQFDRVNNNDYLEFICDCNFMGRENYVRTDFVDTAAILNRINFEKPEGLYNGCTFEELINKVKTTYTINNTQSGYINYFDGEKLANKYSLSLKVFKNFSTNRIDDFDYTISGLPYNKESSIIQMFESKLNGFTKIGEDIYVKNYQKIVFYHPNGQVNINIEYYNNPSTTVTYSPTSVDTARRRDSTAK